MARFKMASEDAKILELAQEISSRLETGLSTPALEAIVDLLRQDHHPDAIVAVIKSLSS